MRAQIDAQVSVVRRSQAASDQRDTQAQEAFDRLAAEVVQREAPARKETDALRMEIAASQLDAKKPGVRARSPVPGKPPGKGQVPRGSSVDVPNEDALDPIRTYAEVAAAPPPTTALTLCNGTGARPRSERPMLGQSQSGATPMPRTPIRMILRSSRCNSRNRKQSDTTGHDRATSRHNNDGDPSTNNIAYMMYTNNTIRANVANATKIPIIRIIRVLQILRMILSVLVARVILIICMM